MVVGAISEAINLVFSWPTLGWVFLGVIIGIIFGAIPGLGATLGLAILLPLTVPLEGTDAIIFLVSIYCGAMYGGSVAAILINVPGTPAAAATTFDGYPLSRQGKAINALTISAISSGLGGMISIIILIILSPILITIILSFGSPEYFLLAILGLSMIAIVSQTSLVKGVISGFFGLLLTTIGMAPIAPEQRYTFDSLLLYDGLELVAALLAMFAVAEMIKLAGERGPIAGERGGLTGEKRPAISDVLSNYVTLIKGSIMGLLIGMIPGSGASVSNFIAYGEAMRSDKNPETFGQGNPKGIVIAESCNNSTVGGALVPTLSFGIPGSGTTAVLLGGLIMHGMQPGPDMFAEDLYITFSTFVTLFVGSIMIMLIGVFVVTRASYITTIDTDIIIPMILVLSAVGGYAVRSNWIDVLTLLVLGVIGFYMKKHGFSVIAFVLGFVLGPIAEENLFRSLQLSDGSFTIFITQPVSALLVVIILVVLIGPYYDSIKKSLKR
jgi:putative tricarboxylic transport membrane protein